MSASTHIYPNKISKSEQKFSILIDNLDGQSLKELLWDVSTNMLRMYGKWASRLALEIYKDTSL